jgi:DNA primase large subunit
MKNIIFKKMSAHDYEMEKSTNDEENMEIDNENIIISENEQNEINNISLLNSDIPPTFYEKIEDNLTMDLQKLINIVVSRYKLLKEIENLYPRKGLFKSVIKSKIPIDLLWTDEETLNNDIASHFLLALIMCNNKQDMKWFLRMENILYKERLRFKHEKKRYNMFKILSLLGMKLNLLEENNNEVDLNKIKFRRNIENEKIYYCEFNEAINLIPLREYYLHKGKIYILENDLPKLFEYVFERKQETILEKIKVNEDNIKKDRRIKEIIISFEKIKESLNYQESLKIQKESSSESKLHSLYDIDKYSEKCFPLCMCVIERHITHYSHLTHFGRLQYTLFLKGGGLPVEEALKFFQKKYEKKTSLEKFNKQYAYYIRHAYGLEGKMTNYAPYNCEKLINMNSPMGNECHGCPFKTYSNENLKNLLNTCNLNDDDIEDILDKKKRNEFQFACVKYFEGKFPGILGEGIGIHPNKYLSSAMKIINGKNNKNKEILYNEINTDNNDELNDFDNEMDLINIDKDINL